MTILQGAFRLVGILWLLALAALVAVGMLKGTITVGGLLLVKTPGRRGRRSATRVQLLLATLAIAALYLKSAVVRPDAARLPALPPVWVIILAASNAIYLTAKVVPARRARARRGASGP